MFQGGLRKRVGPVLAILVATLMGPNVPSWKEMVVVKIEAAIQPEARIEHGGGNHRAGGVSILVQR